MSETDDWFKHITKAYIADTLTLADYEADVEDLLLNIPPRRFLSTVEDLTPVYADSRVPFEWVDDG